MVGHGRLLDQLPCARLQHEIAVAEFVRLYYPAMRAYLVFQGRLSEDGADDMLQGFIADKVLEKELLSKTGEAGCNFRSLLLTCLKNYVVGQARSRMMRADAQFVREIHHAIYLASIAVGMLERGSRISSLDDAALRTAFSFVLRQPRLDPDLRELLRRAAVQLE